MRRLVGMSSVVALLVSLAFAAVAQESQDAMMKKMMEMATPNKHHEALTPMVGKWQLASRFRMSPEAPWAKHNSEAHTEWILGKRFALTRVEGSGMMPGMPDFEGMGLMGYDNAKAKYTTVWVDNMGTMTMTGEGTADKSGKTITLRSKFKDPMSGEQTWMKSVYKIKSDDKFVLEMYAPAPDGKEFLTMEITHTRAGHTSR